MRLLQQTCVREIRHNVADGGRTEALAAAARESTRSYRFARGDEGLDNGGQNFALTRPDLYRLRHI
jgi:hypothetical protein